MSPQHGDCSTHLATSQMRSCMYKEPIKGSTERRDICKHDHWFQYGLWIVVLGGNVQVLPLHKKMKEIVIRQEII